MAVNVQVDPAPPTVPEVMRLLAEPFPPEAVKIRRQGKINNGKARFVAYVDARTVANRLNRVLGGDGWKTRMIPQPSGAVLCRLSVRFPGKTEWIPREDVGGKSEQPDEDDQFKAAVSDALKRAAVNFGVGAYLYKLPTFFLAVNQFGEPSETWHLPLWALPDERKPAGAEGVKGLQKLAATYCEAAGRELNPYLQSLVEKQGYKSDVPLSRMERRHVTAAMRAVNDDIAAHAARPTVGLNTAVVSDKPLSEQGNPPAGKGKAKAKPLPTTGPELLTWLNEIEAQAVKDGVLKDRELIAAVLSHGAGNRYSTSVDEWAGPQITEAVEVARKFYREKISEAAKTAQTPENAGVA